MPHQPESGTSRSPVIPHWHDPHKTRISLVDGKGAFVVDAVGNEYLDCTSQLYCVNAGHDNDAIVSAITDQLKRIPYVSSAQDADVRTELGEEIVRVAPDSMANVVFSVTGSEANELAIAFARSYTDRQKILTRWRSYHGGTYGSGIMTGDPTTRTTFEAHATQSGAVKILPPIAYRSPFPAETPEELTRQAIDHVEYVIRNEGPDSIAAILMEPVAGSSGGYPAPPGYFEQLRSICDRYGILLIADEVITGFGRCGEWFGMQTEGVEPDIMTFAKGVTSSYVPLAGVLTSPDVGRFLEDGIEIGQTFAGHPLGCAAGLAAIGEYEAGLIENVRKLSPVYERELQRLEDDYDVVGEVRGRGFLWGVEFADPSKQPDPYDPIMDNESIPVDDLLRVARDEGVLFGRGRPAYQILIGPPFCITEGDLMNSVEVLRSAIESTFY